MKKLFMVLGLVLAACAATPAAGDISNQVSKPVSKQLPPLVRINGELAVRQVQDDAMVIIHEPMHASNILVVRMRDGSLVVSSSPFETQGTRDMLAWLRSTFHPPRIIAINTHFHFDGTGGNAAYLADGVETYASTQTQSLLLERGEAMRKELAESFKDPAMRARMTSLQIVPASHTFDAAAGLTLTIAGETVRIVYPGPGHAADNVVVHFPERGLLFGGCLIRATRTGPMNLDSADLGHWEAAIRNVERLAPQKVIPGHGPFGGPELFQISVDAVRDAQSR